MTDSRFSNNNEGVTLSDSRGSFDRCVVDGNTFTGMFLDAGIYVVKNTFIVRNVMRGIEIFPSDPGNILEFNTIADNGTTGVACTFSANTPETPFANNLIARNGINVSTSGPCTYPGSILSASVSGLNFVSPNTAPFDYHITSGSTAIGAALGTGPDHDFDNDNRPASGAAVGADELAN